MTAQCWIAGVVGIAAIVDDLTRRQISNWIPCSAFAAGMILQAVEGGWRGAGSAILGTITGAAVFLIFYLLGGMGGGDVKLMAGFGAVLGARQLLEAALWTAGCGGLMAVVMIGASQLRRFWTGRQQVSATEIPASGSTPGTRRESIPYAPAIAAGVWLSLVPKT
ncbi:MAG TPA: prepilin peptidase [Bryobacteraceae bacterium]|nr:prepilin peptidase [Bryobacteraceae bacterium]